MIPPFHWIDNEGNVTTDREQARGRRIGDLRVWNDGRQEKLIEEGKWVEVKLPRPKG